VCTRRTEIPWTAGRPATSWPEVTGRLAYAEYARSADPRNLHPG
jgi:hypothetical protein